MVGTNSVYQEPEFRPWDGRSVPMTLLGGYLGSGKTTVINRLLADANRPIAVLVNDVGQVNIDAALIRRRNQDTIELTDGCVCCSISGSMADAVDQIRARPEPPEHVVVELSGVADPRKVAPWGHSAGFRLDGVVVLADADAFDELHADPMIGPALDRQLAGADLVVLTKTDLVTPEAAADLGGRLAARHDVPVVSSADAAALTAMLAIGGGRRLDVADLPAPTLFDRHTTTVLPVPDPVTPDELDALLDTLGPEVLRAKAIARVVDPETGDAVPSAVHLVGRRRRVDALPQSDLQDPTGLVVISLER